MELYAKIIDGKITEVSSGIGTTGTWVTVEGSQGEDQTLTYDPTSNTVKCEDEIDEIPVATIEELEAVKLEMTIVDVRGNRGRLLAESDWTQFTDSPLSDTKKDEWKTYRQNLRDLPATEADPENATFPTKPS